MLLGRVNRNIIANRIRAITPFKFLPTCQSRLSHTLPRRPYEIEIGVSFAGKRRRTPARKTIGFPSDHPIAQWRDKLLRWHTKELISSSAGEDFFYVTQSIHNSGFSLGISDGIGGWSGDGVDPSLFSQGLMYFASQHAATAWAGEADFDPIQETSALGKSDRTLSPVEIMSMSYQDVLNEPLIECGSSTACIVNIDAQSGKLSAANLGDSSFSIIRSSSILHEQGPQTHYFNCPRQLAKLLPKHQSHLQITDGPEHADTFSAQLRHEDLVILSTDGLGDNVHPAEVLTLASLIRRRTADQPGANFAQKLADGLVEYAVACMHSHDKSSPFEKAARGNGFEYTGGKIDE
ncbi:Protein phosphatase PTC7 [Ceratobasidium theobromae]|uniref:Protein phosphatase n=1 Tax=Ceratobasidium theobromae TaxID=1582974 RepID=A0A5N5QXQ7_9AGAM|nr:Protein phosphatase PTC7 [Ceratobasidium theobromae]